ncbi:hypothetical protein FA15DRAFT_659852 [Coprinopsis marcescibilis]|uniref:Uncharacterized protein n=1 Tax=Coprinopsis marcescibilis TaxID=230819 RepID=A0A5C3KUD1_COPMA|nr:hypothetical protein FA15DRAFT_659852 [Coprinopsis marcescibilis]
MSAKSHLIHQPPLNRDKLQTAIFTLKKRCRATASYTEQDLEAKQPSKAEHRYYCTSTSSDPENTNLFMPVPLKPINASAFASEFATPSAVAAQSKLRVLYTGPRVVKCSKLKFFTIDVDWNITVEAPKKDVEWTWVSQEVRNVTGIQGYILVHDTGGFIYKYTINFIGE